MNRRNFLIGTAGVATIGLGYQMLHRTGLPAGFEIATAYGDWVDTLIENIDPPLKSELVLFDPGSMKMRAFAVPFRVHMLVQNPTRKQQVVAVSKWGREIASIDFMKGKVENLKISAENRRFFGHAAWDEGSGGFWVTEQDDKTKRGLLTLRGPDLEIRHEISSGGMFPHEIQMIKPGVLLAANSGDFFNRFVNNEVSQELRTSNLTWIDTRKGEITRKVEFPRFIGLAGASHFCYIPENEQVIVGTMANDLDQPATVLRVDGDRAEVFGIEQDHIDKFRGEILSFALDPHQRRVLWTHSKAPGVFACHFDGGTVAELAFPSRSRGIAEVNGDIVLTDASKAKVIRMSEGEVRQTTSGPLRFKSKWGSHLVKLQPV